MTVAYGMSFSYVMHVVPVNGSEYFFEPFENSLEQIKSPEM